MEAQAEKDTAYKTSNKMNELPTDQDPTGNAECKAIAESPQDETRTAALLRLPPELRLTIYGYALQDRFSSKTVRSGQRSSIHSLLAVCAEITAETWRPFVRELEAQAVAAYDLSEQCHSKVFSSDTPLLEAIEFSSMAWEEGNSFRVFSKLATKMRRG